MAGCCVRLSALCRRDARSIGVIASHQGVEFWLDNEVGICAIEDYDVFQDDFSVIE